MKIYHSIKDINIKNAVLTVGTFDGVHLGHKKILSKLVENAKDIGGEPVVFTLHPHPRKVLFPETNNLFFLNTIEEKAKLLEEIGIKHFIVYPFTHDFANLSSCNFIEEILFNQLKVKQLIVGYDHHFGKDKQGDFKILKDCTSKFNIEIFKVKAFEYEGITISSTKIRNKLLEGNIELANKYLDYQYSLSGKVVSGNKIGREIGFPTANIEIDKDKVLPKDGVYAVKLIIDNKEYFGMLNIGIRPTIKNSNKKTVEVHLFDFKDNIYDIVLRIYFVKFIRDEQKFQNIEDLKSQLIKDEAIIKKMSESFF